MEKFTVCLELNSKKKKKKILALDENIMLLMHILVT